MSSLATGAAFIDRSGALVAADRGFAAVLGLADSDPSGALRQRAEREPALCALLAGEGPDLARLAGAGGELLELERIAAPGGALLVARAPGLDELLEHAMRSQGLTRLAGGLAHDIKNPLNAMALQLALLADKLSTATDPSAASASHLGALREQIGRVNEAVRRFVDVTDPSAPLGYTDLGGLLADTGNLFGHDSRRRRIELVVEASRGVVRTTGEPARVGRLVLALVSRAMAETPDGGRVHARAGLAGDRATLWIEHVAGEPDPETGYYRRVASEAARALGGGLELSRAEGVERLTLRLPRYEAT